MHSDGHDVTDTHAIGYGHTHPHADEWAHLSRLCPNCAQALIEQRPDPK